MIINIRGTSGSGKTYAVRHVLQHMDPLSVVTYAGKPVANMTHYEMQPVYLIGDYTKNVCGGCDTIATQDLVCSLVRHFSTFGHVIFEGLLISGLFARYAALCKELQDCGDTYVWAFLNTPVGTCLERVQQRRLDRGDDRPLNPANTIGKHEAVWKCHTKASEAGFDVRILEHAGLRSVGQQLLDMLDCHSWEFVLRKESFR